MKDTEHQILAALDIGSSKIAFAIAKIEKHSIESKPQIEVVGLGQWAHNGVKQGVVVDIESTTEAIQKARKEAELMAGIRVVEVVVAISGSHIRSFDSRGMIAIKSKEVTAADIERVIEAAKAVTVPMDRMVLHVIPREFKVDHQEGILNPIGMVGVRLEVLAHIVTGSQATIQNNLKCIERSGLKVKGLVLSQLAASKAVLSEDEKNLGVCLADLGAGATHLIYYVHNSVAHMSQIGIGGQFFTNDIAIGLRTPQQNAEQLKIKHGYCMSVGVNNEETLDVESVGGRKSRTIKKKDLAEIIEPRAEELLNFIAKDMQQSGLAPLLGSGLVLTGGGAHMGGLIDMAEYQLDIPVRLGLPRDFGGLNDTLKSGRFATLAGLLVYSLEEKKFVQTEGANPSLQSHALQALSDKFKGLFKELF